MNKSMFEKKCVKYDMNVKKNKLPRKLYSNSISIEFFKIFEKNKPYPRTESNIIT